MKKLLIVIAFLAVSTSAFAFMCQTDWECVWDCRSNGGDINMCQQMCTYCE